MTKRSDLAAVIAKDLKIGKTKGLAKQIAAFLMENHMTSDVASLMRDVELLREKDGLIEAEVISAHPLTSAALKNVKDIIKSTHPHTKQIRLSEIISPDVIGGLKIRLAEEQLDMTIRAKLDTFKRVVTEGAENA